MLRMPNLPKRRQEKKKVIQKIQKKGSTKENKRGMVKISPRYQ